VLVSNAQGTALDVSDLRCKFAVTKTVQMQPNVSELTIYNLNAETENRLIKEGNRIVIEAGYEGEQYGLIFDGDVIQPLRDKEDGVTYKLTLISMDGDRFFNNGFANTTLLKGQNARSVIENIVSKASNPAKFGSISENLNTSELTRGKVVFGLARDYLRQIALSQNATFFIEDNKVNISYISNPYKVRAYKSSANNSPNNSIAPSVFFSPLRIAIVKSGNRLTFSIILSTHFLPLKIGIAIVSFGIIYKVP
jgi:hypothetical protein